MACYGIATDSIERLAGLIRDFPAREVVNWEPERMQAYAKENHDRLVQLERLFVEAVFTFMAILEAILATRVRLAMAEGQAATMGFREGFLGIYREAALRSRELFLEILAEAFNADPGFRVELISQVSASMVPVEMAQFTRNVDTATTSTQAEAHASAATEITDSAKDLLKRFARHIPFVKRIKKENLQLGLQAVNEVIRIVK